MEIRYCRADRKRDPKSCHWVDGSEGRARIHRYPRTDTPKHRRVNKRSSQVVVRSASHNLVPSCCLAGVLSQGLSLRLLAGCSCQLTSYAVLLRGEACILGRTRAWRSSPSSVQFLRIPLIVMNTSWLLSNWNQRCSNTGALIPKRL